MSNLAVNDQGEAVFFDGRDWKPAQVAVNERGERMAFDGREWTPLGGQAPRSAGESASRMAGQFAQRANDAIASGVGAPVDAISWILRQGGVDTGPAPVGGSKSISKGLDWLASVPGMIGLTTPGAPVRFDPETQGERIAGGLGDAVGNVASMVMPASIIGNTAKAGTVTKGVADAIAAKPALQAAFLGAGNTVGEVTGDPLLGTATTFALPFLMHGAQRAVSAAPAMTGAEAERRKLIIGAAKEGIPLSAGKITDSTGMQMVESVLGKLPFVGNRQAALDQAGRTAFNKAAINKIPAVAGEGIDAATPGAIDTIKARVGQIFNRLQASTTVKIDPQFGDDIARAQADFSQQLRSQMPASIATKLDELASAARTATEPGVTGVSIDGTTYKNIRSKLSAMLSGASGTDKQAVGAMIDALDGAVQRSLPKDMVKDWQNARTSWRRVSMIDDAISARHNGQTAVGNIPPGSLEARAGSDSDMARLGQIGTKYVGDKMPDSGTAMRQMILNGLGLTAGGGAVATGLASPPLAAALTGGGLTLDLILNNPATRKLLTSRLANPSQSIIDKGLVGTLAIEDAKRRKVP